MKQEAISIIFDLEIVVHLKWYSKHIAQKICQKRYYHNDSKYRDRDLENL